MNATVVARHTGAEHTQFENRDASTTGCQRAQKAKWKPIAAINTLSFKGGYMAKSKAVETSYFKVEGENVRFVHVSKKSAWLVSMAGGPLKRAGSVLDELRSLYHKHSTPDESTVVDASAVADGAGSAADPMNQCDAIADNAVAVVDAATPRGKRRRKSDKPTPPKRPSCRGVAMPVTMPRHSPSTHPKNTETVQVFVALTGTKGRGKLWIAERSVYWLVPYLADEVNTGSVALNDDYTPAVAGQPAVAGHSPVANCTVPGLCIRLKPQRGNMDEYEALFVQGPLTGTKLVSKVSTMTQVKWDMCQATASHWKCPGPHLDGAQRNDVVRAVCHLLELAMAKKLLVHSGQTKDADEDPIEWAARAAQ